MYGDPGQSGQAIILIQAPRKISFTFHFWHESFILDDVKIAELFHNSFEWKICDIFYDGGQNILWPLLHIFRGYRPQIPKIYAPGPCHLLILAWWPWLPSRVTSRRFSLRCSCCEMVAAVFIALHCQGGFFPLMSVCLSVCLSTELLKTIDEIFMNFY